MLKLGFGSDYKGGEFLQAAFDGEQSEKVSAYAPNFEDELKIGTRMNVLRLLGDTTRTVQFDFAAIMRKRNPSNQHLAMQASSRVLEALVNSAGREDDPTIFAEFCGRYLRDSSRISLHADLRWPNSSDDRLYAVVTPRMQRVAKAIKLFEEEFIIREDVGVSVNRESGSLAFSLLLMGGSMLGTNGKDQEIKIGKRVHVSSANLYSDEMAIVAFAGAVAFAHADELEPLPEI